MREEPKLKDSLGRSWRFAPPEDDGKFFALSKADLKVIELLDDHGPLPSSYLWREAQKYRKDELGFKKWLRKAYVRGNTPDRGAYLTRPPQQKAAYRADRQDLTHDITDAGKRALKRSGLPTFPSRTDHMHHRFMNACVTASVRFSAEEHNLSHVRLKDILAHPSCPQNTRGASSPLMAETSRGKLVPDDLSGLAYPRGDKATYRFLAWEQDRATETLDTIQYKFDCYLDVLKHRLHSTVWGLPNLYVACVTTAPLRLQNMIERLEQITRAETELRPFFLFKCKSVFHEEWLVPPIMTDLLSDTWQRAGLPGFSLLES